MGILHLAYIILCDFHQYFVVHRFHKYVLCQINVKFLWSGLFLQTVVQTIVGLNTGPEVYMSAKACINWPSPHFHCSLTMLKYMWLGNAFCQLLCAQICESFHWSSYVVNITSISDFLSIHKQIVKISLYIHVLQTIDLKKKTWFHFNLYYIHFIINLVLISYRY